METPKSPLDLIIEPIAKSHIVRDFSCGEKSIDLYIKRFAKKSTIAGYGRTYVAVKPGHFRVWAYYTIAASYVDASSFHSLEGCPKNISVALLERIGVEEQLRGKGFGDALMAHAFQVALQSADLIGIHAVILGIGL